MNERILDLLYRSFDDELTKEEQRELAEALSSSLELREEKKRITEMRQRIADEAIRSFKPFFSARVLQRLKEETVAGEDFFESIVWAFRRIALAGAAALLLLIATNVLTERTVSLDSLLGMPQLTLEDTWQLENPVLEEKL